MFENVFHKFYAVSSFQAILKTNKWRSEYGVSKLTADIPEIKSNLEANKARVLKHRDMYGRPVIYIPAKNHNATNRNIDELTKFIVYCLVSLFTLNSLYYFYSYS